MRFTFFEYVFFISAFGTVAFFPAALPFMPLLALPTTALTVACMGIFAFIGLTLHEKKRGEKTPRITLCIAAIAGCVALLISIMGRATSPAFALWSLNAILATFTFGSILARQFFRRVERDFRRNASHALVIGLAINAAGLLAANLFTVFPPTLVAILTAIITCIALI